MHMRLLQLMLALVGWLPITSAATTELQSRFENSLRAASSIPRVEVEWLDTLSDRDPEALRTMHVSGHEFVRVVRYSYLASGPKYRLTWQLVSGTGTNLVHHKESAFDGTTFYFYRADSHYLTKTRDATLAGSDESPNNPLLAPFMFLTPRSDDCINCGLRFTELASLIPPQELASPKKQGETGDIEISILLGLPVGGQPTTWKLELEGAGEAFMPKTITSIAPGWRAQLITLTLAGIFSQPGSNGPRVRILRPCHLPLARPEW